MVFRYLSLFLLNINIEIGKIDFYVRLAGGHLYGKQLFTWLSLVVSLIASFCAALFPLDVLDEIWDVIESVSEGFLTYSWSYSKYLHYSKYLKEQLTST